MAPDEGTGEAVELAEAPATPEAEPADETVNLNAPEEQQVEEPEQPEQPVEEEFEEVDFEGSRYKLPKALKSAFMAQKDYTEKSQKNAERSRELDTLFERANQQLQASDEEIRARAKAFHIDAEIERLGYDKLSQQDWLRWSQEAPIDAQSAYMAYQMMQKEKSAVTLDIEKWQNERSEQAKSETTRRLQETEEFARKIPGWTPEVGKQIADMAQTKWGITREVLEANITPQLYDVFYHANIGLQALQSKAATPPQPPQNLKPLTTISAKQNAPVRKNLADMDMHEYVAAREAQMKGRR
jgi:hypothetical protein